jgi:hypothetical protein
MTPCVVVHADERIYRQVRAWLKDFGEDILFLHAPRTERKRGEPCNVALSFLEKNRDEYDFFCFLDDDDHLLPNFAERLTAAARFAGADIAVGLTNAIHLDGSKSRLHSILPTSTLCACNFIPINSYIVRTSALVAARARFDPSIDYLEDWDFLLQLLGAGACFAPLYETVSEFRLIGDGNVEVRRDPEHYRECVAKVSYRGRRIAARLSASAFWRDVLDFPGEQMTWLNADEDGDVSLVQAARDVFAMGEA